MVDRSAGLLGPVLVAAVIVCLGLLSVLRPIDEWLVDHRFGLDSRAPSAGIVLVEIDPASLREVGVWPWPRHVYADLLDRLMAAGAADTVFDIDFSSASTPTEDAAFAKALADAGGYAALAGFRQLSPATGRLVTTLPLPRFREQAATVMVNVDAETDGIVRRYPPGISTPAGHFPSLAEYLSGVTLPSGKDFYIDYGIDPTRIDRISVADVLAGHLDPARIAGKQVVIGASAQELRDLFTVPRFGVVPGAMLQVLATDTLKQHRALHGTGMALPLALVVLFAGLAILARRRLTLGRRVLAGLALLVGTEALALLLEAKFNLLLPTAAVDLALVGLVAAAVIEELQIKRRQHATAARERERMRRILDQVVTDNFDGVVIIDDAARIVAASSPSSALLGIAGPLVGHDARAVLPAGLADPIELLLAATEGDCRLPAPAVLVLDANEGERRLEYFATRSAVTPDPAGRGQGAQHVVCLTFRDISERHRHEQRLAYLARHDPLTGTLSRGAFVETIESALASEAVRLFGMTVLLVNLGRFRIVNDTLGHAYGDLVLKEAARRLGGLDVLVVGRVGGDSFALAMLGQFEAAAARRFCDIVIALLCEPYVFDGRRAVLSAHAGFTSTAVSGTSGDVLLSHADMALSVARNVPGSAAEVFTPALVRRLESTQNMEAALREGLERRQFSVHYQPQVALATGEIVGVEALVRWHHPELGNITPDRFIPVAEETGMIVELGRFVLETACREVASWPTPVRLAVNVSPVQFEIGDVVADVRHALAASRLAADRLDLEITEGQFVGEAHPVIQGLARLHRLGVGIALDDFGTGYSSLGYLGRLPIGKLKIDWSFVRNLPDDQEALAIVTMVQKLADSLNKTVVAEGVETAAQAELLARLGCQIGQGYLFGRPVPAEQLRDRLAAPESEPRQALAG